MTEKFFKLPQDIAARRDLLASDKLVYAVILDCSRDKGICWPSKRYLSRRTGLSGQAVLNATARLEKAKVLLVERRENGKSNYYKTGQQIRPVNGLDRSKSYTTGGQRNRPEAVNGLDPNKTDQLNQTENFPFSSDELIEPTPETPDPGKVQRVLESLAL